MSSRKLEEHLRVLLRHIKADLGNREVVALPPKDWVVFWKAAKAQGVKLPVRGWER